MSPCKIRSRAAWIHFLPTHHSLRAVLLSLGLLASAFTPAWADTARPVSLSAPPYRSSTTALDRYVAAPDPNYHWEIVSTNKGPGYTAFNLMMTSQSWLTTNEINRTLWKHWMVIIRPDEVKSQTGLLFIGGGNNNKPAPGKVDENLVQIAVGTHSVITELRQVPNQPVTFAGETKERVEDSLIAYTWDKYLRTGDEKWPARLPMTKSAVRAMDTVTAFCATDAAGKITIDKFFVAGGSKRGWTTWTTAAVDKRVVAIAPIVIDLLNIVPSFIHHWEAYGFWAPAVGDYVQMGIMDWTNTKEYAALMKIEEPFEYRDRLTMPKFMINACGDQFFLPDSSQFYFNELTGIKYLRYIPNTDHSLRGSDAYKTLASCYQAILQKDELPKFTWTKQSDGSLKVITTDNPSQVRLWQATNPKARDFRLETIGKTWTSSPLEPESNGVYVGKISAPAEGWSAFMVELTFPSKGLMPYQFTTEVVVTPNTFPHPYVPPARHPKNN